MLYYLLIAVSTVMFGSQFFFQKRYQQNEGTNLYKSVAFALGTSAAGAVIMLMISKGKIEFSWFSFVLAAVSAAVNILLCYCSAMVLSYSNLSLYSLFMMLGGMLLPFMLGIVCQCLRTISDDHRRHDCGCLCTVPFVRRTVKPEKLRFLRNGIDRNAASCINTICEHFASHDMHRKGLSLPLLPLYRYQPIQTGQTRFMGNAFDPFLFLRRTKAPNAADSRKPYLS